MTSKKVGQQIKRKHDSDLMKGERGSRTKERGSREHYDVLWLQRRIGTCPETLHVN